MAEMTIQVTEQMAAFIGWANAKGEDEVRKMVREYLAEIKAQNETTKESTLEDGYKWNDLLEPNDDADQWNHGGDCNLCRKADYCLKKCRANKLLKSVMTPFLYTKYLEETPEALARSMGAASPEALMKQIGVIQ